MKINPFLYGVVTVIVFLGIIAGFQQAGAWSTSGKVRGSGQRVEPSAANVTTVKGWMTLEQVSTTFHVPLADILSAFNLPAGTPPGTALKDLESDTFSIPALRTWLQAHRQPVP
jgi:hypothetical protein